MFESDDYPRYFEIYRTDFPPLSYRDFNLGRGKITLDNSVRGTVVRTANSTIDSVVPNKKYWYTFRVVDVHWNVSNPTPVLEFEMVDTGNSIFPLIQEYHFPKPEISYVKPMRKYLKVSPSTIQEARSDDADSVEGFKDNPLLGPDAEKKIWNKKYKLRLTSKLSGKRIDINFVFKQKDICDSTDVPCGEGEAGGRGGGACS